MNEDEARRTQAFDVLGKSEIVRCFDDTLHSPEALVGAIGGVLYLQTKQTNTSRIIPVICGGSEDNLFNIYCFELGTHEPLASLQNGRLDSASTVIDNGKALWVTGGRNPNAVQDSTELIEIAAASDDDVKVTQGMKLPRPMDHHCLETVNDNRTTVIVYKEDESWSVDLESGNRKWTQRASMPHESRRALYACGVIKDVVNPGLRYVVAAGGQWSFAEPDKRVNLLRVKVYADTVLFDDKWTNAPDLPHKIVGADSATTLDRTILFLAGGHTQYIDNNNQIINNGSKSIYSFQCADSNCQWTTLNTELANPRRHLVAMVLPALKELTLSETGNGGNVDDPCQFAGDGECDGATNNPACNFDNGDCCLVAEPNEMNAFCSGVECYCHQSPVHTNPTIRETTSTTMMTTWTQESNFDLRMAAKTYWQYKIFFSASQCDLKLIDNGICDGDQNNEECAYDGGDCCSGTDRQCYFCHSGPLWPCACHITGVHTCDGINSKSI